MEKSADAAGSVLGKNARGLGAAIAGAIAAEVTQVILHRLNQSDAAPAHPGDTSDSEEHKKHQTRHQGIDDRSNFWVAIAVNAVKDALQHAILPSEKPLREALLNGLDEHSPDIETAQNRLSEISSHVSSKTLAAMDTAIDSTKQVGDAALQVVGSLADKTVHVLQDVSETGKQALENSHLNLPGIHLDDTQSDEDEPRSEDSNKNKKKKKKKKKHKQ